MKRRNQSDVVYKAQDIMIALSVAFLFGILEMLEMSSSFGREICESEVSLMNGKWTCLFDLPTGFAFLFSIILL